MAFAPAPLINGHRYSFASIEMAAIIGGNKAEIFPDIYNIKYSEKLNVSFVRGTSRLPIGWTAGTWEPGDASISMGKSSFTTIPLLAGNGWMGTPFQMLVSYADVGEIFTVDVLTARITGIEDDHSEGPDGLVSVVTLLPISITRNGIASVLGSPF